MKIRKLLYVLILSCLLVFPVSAKTNFTHFFRNIMMLSIDVPTSSTWYTDDWTSTVSASAKTVTLTKYKGTSETYKIPSKAIVNGEEYQVILGGTYPFQNTVIKELEVEEGLKLKTTSYLFYQAKNLESVDLRGANTSEATSLKGMFYGASNLKKVNLSGLDFSKVTNVQYMFYQASKVEEIDMSDVNFSKITSFTKSNPTNNFAASPFYGMYELKKINIRNLKTPSLTTAQRMFTIDANNSGNKNHLEEIDVTGWDTSNITTFNEIFKHCGENNDVVIKGLETLDVSKVTDFGGAFQATYNLKDLSGVENWNTASAQRMNSMFSEAKSIKKLDLSRWDTSNVTVVSSMFVACESLEDINVSTWDTSKVKQMDEVFKGCSSLEVLNLKNWTSESVENKAGSHMNEMFGIGASQNAGDYTRTPLKEITLNENFVFSTFVPPGLRSGYWHLKEGTDEEVSKRFTPARLYTAYNSNVTPGDGYSHDHTYVLTELDPATAEYYAHGWGDNNVWEVHYPADKFKGYCINLRRGSPNGYYDRTKVKNNSIIDMGFLDSDNYGWAPLGNNMEEALITLIYYGYGNDADGIQEKYGLTDGEFLLITQQAIWDFTDRYNNMPERDRNTKYGQAHYELVSKRFSDIPNNDKLKLYLYESIDGKQNLLSISGLSDVAHSGVRVLKLTNDPDGSFVPLIGAEFTIYDSDNNEVGKVVSDENGYATKYNTDSIYGLPEGIYKIRETKVPRGYRRSNSSYYSFIVRPEDDNEIITIGKLNASGEEVPMIFENIEDTTVEGGGLIIKTVDQNDNPILSESTFNIIDENGNVVGTVTTSKNGEVKTGNKDLLLNKKYKAILVNGPKGYIATVTEKNDTLTENGKYKTLIFKFITKTCKVNIQVLKKYNKPLVENEFKFELIDPTEKVTSSSNDSEGQVSFSLEYDAKDLGFMTYKIKEVKGTLENVKYDEHEEEVIVHIEDDGEEELSCTVTYDEDGAEFNNTYEKQDDTPSDEVQPEDKSEILPPPDKPVPKTRVETNTSYWFVVYIMGCSLFIGYETFKIFNH